MWHKQDCLGNWSAPPWAEQVPLKTDSEYICLEVGNMGTYSSGGSRHVRQEFVLVLPVLEVAVFQLGPAPDVAVLAHRVVPQGEEMLQSW